MINTTKQILMQMDVKEEARMEIKKPAIAGTLESSDCQVTVEAGEGKVDFSLESAVINQYGRALCRHLWHHQGGTVDPDE